MPHHLYFVIGTLLVSFVSTQRHESELKSLIGDTDVNNKVRRVGVTSTDDEDFEVLFEYPKKEGVEGEGIREPPKTSKPVKRLWGVPDTETHVGKAFSYPIPDDAFDGDVVSYQFLNLPYWLAFNSRKGVLEGVPAPSDVGPHYITVRAEGVDGAGTKDDFAVQVNLLPASVLLKEARCSPRADLTVLSVTIDAPLSSLQPRHRVELIRRVSHLFMTKSKRISLNPTTEIVDPMDDDSAIAAGPGKFKPGATRKRSDSSTSGQILVQWGVGCNGEVNKEELEVVKSVERSAKSGEFEEEIELPVVGWVLTKINPETNRVRRDADYSGDYDDADYDYNYDEAYFNLKKVADRAPSAATPVFTEFPATAGPGEVPASPVFRPVPLSTPVYVPVKPTRVVESSPIMGYKTEYPWGPGGQGADLESSLLIHPTTSADYTTPLTKTSSVYSEPTREGSGPIEATSVPDVGFGVTTEYAVKNFPPRIQNRIQKLAWVAGNMYRLRIAEDAFTDVEDGGTRNLTLVLKDERGYPFSRDSWIQFDPAKQEVYALPLEKDIGRYDFRLQAIDRGRKSVIDYLEISVWQHQQARIFHHQFTAVLRMEKKYEYEFAYSLDWQVKAVEKIAALFKDSVDSLNVRNITTDPVQISWTNVSLVDSSSTTCPTEELEAIAEVMLSGHGSEPSRQAKRVFLPEFTLKKIHSHFYDPCENHFHHHNKHHTHSETNVHPFTPMEGAGGTATEENFAPIIRNQIDFLQASVGHLYRYQVPSNMCYDLEDGNARNLKLQLLTIDLSPPPRGSWLQFDAANQEFFGLPLEGDLGSKEYLLECKDKGDRSVSDALYVEVIQNPMSESLRPVIFSVSIDTPYEAFMLNAYDKTRFLQRLGRAFGDSGPEHVTVNSMRPGSVVVEWYNNSLPNDPCPQEEVMRLREIMTDDSGDLRPDFKQAFLPDFTVSSARAVVPDGSCLADDTPTHLEEPEIPVPEPDETSQTGDENYLLTFIIPAVIIALMLLLAALIACCLYRRRRYGKMSLAGDRTFVSKGIPIIFAEELDDHRAESAKSPVIMKEEKPPLPPPEYQRNTPPRASDPRPQRPPSGDEVNGPTDDAPYHRPPPFTASNGGSRNQRPNLPPAYRKPPTYVPP